MRMTISRLVILIAIVSSICAIVGIFSKSGEGRREFTTINNEIIEIYGNGVYRNNSVSVASQAIAQDIVTMLLGVPLLVVSLILSRKTLRGLFLLTGTLGYFLYTYLSYVFLAMYNYLFLFYVILMSSSLCAFILCIILIAKHYIKDCFKDSFNSRFIGGFMLFLAVFVGLMWLGRIIPPLLSKSAPFGLEHYNTLVIQALDLGLIVPVSFLAGIYTLKKKTLGYLLSSIMIIKGISLLTAITAMIILMVINGAQTSIIEMIIFPLFNLIAVFSLVLIIKQIKQPVEYKKVELNV